MDAQGRDITARVVSADMFLQARDLLSHITITSKKSNKEKKMKMKNIFSLAVIALAALSSCSNIAEDERFIPGEMVGGGGKNILIEDFTGQNCVNCPLAMEELEKLHILGIGINGVDSRITFLVGTVLLQSIEAACHLLGILGDGLLQVTTCG